MLSFVVDRIGFVKTITISTALLGVLQAVVGVSKNLIVLAVAIFFLSFVRSINTLAIETYVSYVYPRRLEEAYSYLYAVLNIAWAVGAFLAFLPDYLANAMGMGRVAIYSYSMVLCGTIVAILSIPLSMLEEARDASSHRKSFRETLRVFPIVGRAIGWILISEVLIGFGAGLSIHNIDYYLVLKYRVGSSGTGLLHGLEALGLSLLMLAMPRLSARTGGAVRTYVLVASTSIPLLLALTMVNSYPIAVALFAARTILMNAASPLFTAFVAKIVDPRHRAHALSILSLANTISRIPARSLGGYLMAIDIEAPFRITAMIYSVALSLLALRYWRYEEREGSSSDT